MSSSNNTLNTLAMARKEREKYGQWEAEVSYGGEVDFRQLLKVCKKNPDHLNFVPVDQFNVDHLPPGYRDNDLVNLVRAISDLTVRVSIKYVSDRRPETFPGTDKPYPRYSNMGGNLITTGTGWVREVGKYSNGGKTCDCKDCLNSENPRTEFAHIGIRTAAHVVYDELEAAHTTCHLFFDRGSTPAACGGVVTLSGMSQVESDEVRDSCSMTYVTHDLDLVDKLDKLVDHYRSVYHNYRLLHPYPPLISSHSPQYLTIIVSHPHGCSKQVSVGFAGELDNQTSGDDKLIYTTATCPGSSGAFVWVNRKSLLPFGVVAHTGKWKEGQRLNFSMFWWG